MKELSCKVALALSDRLIAHLAAGCEQVSRMGELRRASDRLLAAREGVDQDHLAECEAAMLSRFELLMLPKLYEEDSRSDRMAALDRYLHELVQRPELSAFIRLTTPRAHDQRQLLVTLPKHGEVRCDLYTVPADDEWVTALLYKTGSTGFVSRLEQQAAKLGLELQDNGLFRGDHQLAVDDEAALFQRLGLTYVRPGDRG